MADLSQVLADIREEAQTLRRNRASFSVERLEQFADEVAIAAEEWLLWLSEGDAAIRCGYSSAWLRARFEGWRRDGHARMNGRARQYRAAIIPRRANTSDAAARGRDAAKAMRKAG